MLKKRDSEMIIQTILRSEFDRLVPHNLAMENFMVQQVEWFSNRSGNMLGAIAKGEGVAGWNYVILKRDMKGDVRVRKVIGNCFNLNAARVDLLLSMTGFEKVDCANQPNLPVLLTSPASSRVVDRICKRSDIPLAV